MFMVKRSHSNTKKSSNIFSMIGKGVVALIIIIVLFLIIVSVVTNSTNSGSPSGVSNQPAHTPLIIVQSGNVYPLNAGSYEEIQFSISNPSTITGSFTTTNTATRGIDFYIMTPDEFSSFSSSSQVNQYLYTTGLVTSGFIDTNLPAGTYYLIFNNNNLVETSSVDITQNIIATS